MNQWQQDIMNLFKKPNEQAAEVERKSLCSSTAAVPSSDEQKPLHVGKRRIKENYTSHWDLDYLPRKEADELLVEIGQDKSL